VGAGVEWVVGESYVGQGWRFVLGLQGYALGLKGFVLGLEGFVLGLALFGFGPESGGSYGNWPYVARCNCSM